MTLLTALTTMRFVINELGGNREQRCRHGHRIRLPWVRCLVCKP